MGDVGKKQVLRFAQDDNTWVLSAKSRSFASLTMTILCVSQTETLPCLLLISPLAPIPDTISVSAQR
jgi:hypothetical protein